MAFDVASRAVHAAIDPIALRLGALRIARRRGRTREAAWAAARIRLEGVQLVASEERFARTMRVKLGHALRLARTRRPPPVVEEIVVPIATPPPRKRRGRLAALAWAVALLLVLLLALSRAPVAKGGEPSGSVARAVAVIATPPPPLRGRTQPDIALLIAVIAPAPTSNPVAGAPADSEAAAAGTGTGSGASGPSGTPAPTAAPTPFIDPQYLVHVRGRVVDGSTRLGVANVCISYGALECGLAGSTDVTGNFDIALDGRSSWIFRFIATNYITTNLNAIRLRPGAPIDVGVIVLRRGS